MRWTCRQTFVTDDASAKAPAQVLDASLRARRAIYFAPLLTTETAG